MSSIQVRLAAAAPKACTCVNATPRSVSVAAHNKKCGYRIMLEAIEVIDLLQAKPLLIINPTAISGALM